MSLYSIPTNDELHELSTGDLFKSNLFKLQVTELLSQVSISASSDLEKTLFSLKKILDESVSIDALQLSEATRRLSKHKIQIPFPQSYLPKDVNYTFAFEKPCAVNVVGSFLLSTMTKHPNGVYVDVAVQMPTSLFQEKDHLNYRYAHKRAYYLASLALIIKKSELDLNIEYEAFQGDLRRPVLILRKDNSRNPSSSKNILIRIFPTIAADCFNISRLAPARNNIRAANQPATPYYNTSILFDSCLVSNLNFLHHHATNSKNFKDAAMLGKVWLAQRFKTERGFNGFLFSMIMAYLLQVPDSNGVKKLSNEFSSFQLFKLTIDFLSTHDFKNNPVFITPFGTPLDSQEFSADEFKKYFDVVIVDPTGKINLAAVLSSSNLDELQYEATLTLKLLKDFKKDHFESIFLKKVYPDHLRFDHFSRISATEIQLPGYSADANVDYPSQRLFALYYLPKVLKKALKNRIKLLSMQSQVLGRWSIKSEPPKENNLDIFIGLVVDPENSLREVEQGPSADDTAAVNQFRRIWGEKSEVRRYQDGTIVESVVFESDGSFQDKAQVLPKMMKFLLSRHMGVKVEEGVTYWSDPFNNVLKPLGIKQISKTFRGIEESFSLLSKQLKSLNDLPLSIMNVIPSHSSLYKSSVFVPQPQPDESVFASGYRPYLEPCEVIIEFESSGHWPDDLLKLQQMKLAFYLKIAKSLSAQCAGTISQVNIGQRDNIMASGWIDITTTDNYKFRCRIHCEREKHLIDRMETCVIPKCRKEYYTRYIYNTAHASRMQNLVSVHPFLSVTIRLIKRWISSHLLTGKISEQAIEIICASVFVNESEWSSPSSSWVGFIRVLELISSHSWKTEPLIVEMKSEGMTLEIKESIAKEFKTFKGAMFVATEYSSETYNASLENTNVVVLNRLIALSKSCLKLIKEKLYSGEKGWIQKLFMSPIVGYDAILVLDPIKCSRYRESLSFDETLLPSIKPKYKNLITAKDRESALISRIDTVQMLINDLEAAFSEIAYFFFDGYGGNMIAIVWKEREALYKWRVDVPFNSIPKGELFNPKKKQKLGQVEVNYKAMLGEMERIGQGIIEGVQMNALEVLLDKDKLRVAIDAKCERENVILILHAGAECKKTIIQQKRGPRGKSTACMNASDSLENHSMSSEIYASKNTGFWPDKSDIQNSNSDSIDRNIDLDYCLPFIKLDMDADDSNALNYVSPISFYESFTNSNQTTDFTDFNLRSLETFDNFDNLFGNTNNSDEWTRLYSNIEDEFLI